MERSRINDTRQQFLMGFDNHNEMIRSVLVDLLVYCNKKYNNINPNSCDIIHNANYSCIQLEIFIIKLDVAIRALDDLA